MAGILIVIIYICFISLGLPDSLFGTAWPVIYPELDIGVSMAGVFTFVTCMFTVVASLVSVRVIKRYGTGLVSAISTLLTAIAMYGISTADSMLMLCIYAVPFGLGAGCIDAALNNYVALHYKASHMNFLHCFYGVGVTVSPFIMSIMLEQSSWRNGYVVVASVQLIIAIMVLISLPLWRKAHNDSGDNGAEEKEEIRIISYREMAKDRRAVSTWLIFIAYCGIEISAGSWGSTFLVLTKGVSPEVAARCVMLYYGGLAMGRLVSGFVANRLTPKSLIYIGTSVMGASIMVLLIPSSYIVASIALFMIGFGEGPIYPNLMHLTPIHFGREMSQSMMGAQSASAFVGSAFLPPLFGVIAQGISAGLLPLYLLILYVIMLLALVWLMSGVNKSGVVS